MKETTLVYHSDLELDSIASQIQQLQMELAAALQKIQTLEMQNQALSQKLEISEKEASTQKKKAKKLSARPGSVTFIKGTDLIAAPSGETGNAVEAFNRSNAALVAEMNRQENHKAQINKGLKNWLLKGKS